MRNFQIILYVTGCLFICTPINAQGTTSEIGDTLQILITDQIDNWNSKSSAETIALQEKLSSIGGSTFFDNLDGALDSNKAVELGYDSLFIVYYYDDQEYDEYSYLIQMEDGKYSYFQYDYIAGTFNFLGKGNPILVFNYFDAFAELSKGVDSNLYFTAFIVEGQVKDFTLASSFARFPHLDMLVTFMNVLQDTLKM